ncbi:MAG: prephenate dehydrogenase [Oscillospiraceae bacterium]|nr:prephenate dehydrogenase [Oscillospiraceae bacterium]
MTNNFKITIVGLGLIGGSLAMALPGFKNVEIVGVDNNPDVIEKARKLGITTADAATALSDADLVVICIYPDNIVPFLRDNTQHLKIGALITEVCGVKEKLAAEIREILPETVDYIGIHPMAGKEVEGIDVAESTLFNDTGFIITPVETSNPDNIKFLEDLASYIGATRIATTTPRKHDEIIAYTSDLMHVASAALCLDYQPDMSRAYTAGAFRDCTRVAMINPELWTELLLANKEHTLTEIDRFLESIKSLRTAIERKDAQILRQLLQTVRKNKKGMSEQ